MKHFVSLLDQAISVGEKEGLEKMFSMLLALRQQMYIKMKAEEAPPIRLTCDCGKEVVLTSPLNLPDNFEYVGTDQENNPVFRCKDCGVDVWG